MSKQITILCPSKKRTKLLINKLFIVSLDIFAKVLIFFVFANKKEFDLWMHTIVAVKESLHRKMEHWTELLSSSLMEYSLPLPADQILLPICFETEQAAIGTCNVKRKHAWT